MIRHFVSTGYVVHGDSILLHWHKKVKEWIPPGGHLEPDEDPVQAVVREVFEETGISVSVMPVSTAHAEGHLRFGNLDQLEPPVTILVEQVHDEKFGSHEHIDFIYFTFPKREEVAEIPIPVPEGWVWVSAEQLERRILLPSPSGKQPPPDDVIRLGLMAVGAYRDFDRSM